MEVLTPAGKRAFLAVEEACLQNGQTARCAVRKDAGDDPDVTNKVLVYASASFLESEQLKELYYEDEACSGLYLTGGEGIGLVTRKGLSCPVGYHAINPVPRAMIFKQAELARRQAGMETRPILIEISIPAGVALSAHTFNPKLGIRDGLSVLGTSGIVNPMSEQALLETIRLEIRVRAAEGDTLLAAAPGNYGEAFLKEKTGMSMDRFVKCSNFIGDTFRMLREEGIEQCLLAGHIGKLVKVAGGELNTHSRYGDRRMEILSACAKEAGVEAAAADPILMMNTTEEAAAYLEEQNVLYPVMQQIAERIKQVLERESGVATEVILFVGEARMLAMTGQAAQYVNRLNGRLEK